MLRFVAVPFIYKAAGCTEYVYLQNTLEKSSLLYRIEDLNLKVMYFVLQMAATVIITANSVPGTTHSGSLSGLKRAETSCQDLATVLLPLFQVPPGNNAANNYRLRVEGFSKVTCLFLFHSATVLFRNACCNILSIWSAYHRFCWLLFVCDHTLYQ